MTRRGPPTRPFRGGNREEAGYHAEGIGADLSRGLAAGKTAALEKRIKAVHAIFAQRSENVAVVKTPRVIGWRSRVGGVGGGTAEEDLARRCGPGNIRMIKYYVVSFKIWEIMRRKTHHNLWL